MSKKYEALVIFSRDVREDQLDQAIARFVAEIQKFGATIESTDVIGRRPFARVIDKREQGLYAKVRFDVDPANVTALRNRFRLYDEVYRLQIVTRNVRIEAAKAKDDARRAAFMAKMEEKAAAAAAQAAAEEKEFSAQ
ncbi:MAG: 30S ribosomal protein S6 [Kiritimatiellia bacterium]